MSGYNFSEEVREALGQARHEAVALRHPYVDTEHLLLGVTFRDTTIASRALVSQGLDVNAIRATVERTVKRGPNPVGPDLPYTSRAKHVLEAAMAEGRELGYRQIDTGLLLLGILRETKGLGHQILSDAGLPLDGVRRSVLELLRQGTSETVVPSPNESLHLTKLQAQLLVQRLYDVPAIAAIFAEHSLNRDALLNEIDKRMP